MPHRGQAGGASSPPPAPTPDSTPPGSPSRRWRKVLYERQPHGDAHTGDSFLADLVVNATVPHRDYATVVWSTLVVDQQLATVAGLGSASYRLHQGTLSTRRLLLFDVLLMALGSLAYLAASAWGAAKQAATAATAAAGAGPASLPASPAKPGVLSPVGSWGGSPWPSPAPSPSKPGSGRNAAGDARGGGSSTGRPPGWRAAADGAASLASLAAATALLSPLLGTLTETVSSDSVVACACLLQLAHLFLHDYHFTAALTAHLSGSLALGCAVCGSVLVASRLGSPGAVYAQLLLSLELFILGPYCRRAVAAAGAGPHAALTAAMAACAAASLARHSVLLTSSFCCALAFVTLVCPMWLVRIHKFKAAINGPWDEAVPRLSRAVTRRLAEPAAEPAGEPG